MKKNFKLFVLVALAISTKAVFAQGVPDDPDLQVPVDGGIVSVVGSAIAYGVYRLKNKNK
jgi:hypothetical protein